MPVKASELTQQANNSEYFDIENLTDKNSALFVSVATIGEAEVGKTTLLVRFASRRFEGRRVETISYDHSQHWIKTNHPYYDRITQVTLYDTAGQERYRAFGARILRETEAVLLTFDCTKRATFEKCREWRELITENNSWCVCMLIANKVDLYREKDAAGKFIHEQWLATPEMSDAERVMVLASGGVDMHKAALDLQCYAGCYAVSCKTGENVDNAFVELVDLAIERQIKLATEMSNNNKPAPSGDARRARQNKLDLRSGTNNNKQAVKVTNNTTKISCC